MSSTYFIHINQPLITSTNKSEIIQFFKQFNIIPNDLDCFECMAPLTWITQKDTVEGFTWICREKKCSVSRVSIQTNTIFEGTRMSLNTWLAIIWYWSCETTIKATIHSTGTSDHVIIGIFQMLREVCGKFFKTNPIKLGGSGSTLEIDESCFNFKPKFHRGQSALLESWVFGIVDTSFVPAQSYLELVPNRSENTLLPIIKKVCLPGSKIHSDGWKAYTNISSRLCFDHEIVNHSNPEHCFLSSSVVHTQTIESYWSKCKYRSKVMKGIQRECLPSYLSEWMWRDCFSINSFETILNHISEYFFDDI